MFGDSHIVAFSEKVMVVRDTSVFAALACPVISELFRLVEGIPDPASPRL